MSPVAMPRLEVYHGSVVEGQLDRCIEIVLNTDLTTNTNTEREVTKPCSDVCTGANIPVKTFNDVPTPLVSSGELKSGIVISAISPVVESEIHLNTVQVGTDAPHK